MPADDGTKVTLTHTGFGPGPEWDEAVAESEKGWSIGLENLQSVLETGIDLREARQPFLGINLEPLDPDRIAKEGIAAEAGIYLTGVVEGHGAEVAGLQRGDVIVGMDKFEIRDFDSLITALRAYRAGDRVEVAYVRGQEQLTTTVELGPRPMPEIPEDPAELAARIREQQEQINAELAEAVAGLTEAAAKQAPAPGEWQQVCRAWRKLKSHVPDLRAGRGPPIIGLIALASFAAATAAMVAVDQRWPAWTGLGQVAAIIVGFVWTGQFFWRREEYRARWGDLAYRNAFARHVLTGLPVIFAAIAHNAYLPGHRVPLGWATPVVSALGLYLMITGLVLWVRSALTFGLDNLAMLYVYFPDESRLVESSIYSVIRHPVYFTAEDLALKEGGFVAPCTTTPAKVYDTSLAWRTNFPNTPRLMRMIAACSFSVTVLPGRTSSR